MIFESLLQSHSLHYAHWDGECGLSVEEQQHHLLRNLTDLSSEQSLSEALEDVHMEKY